MNTSHDIKDSDLNESTTVKLSVPSDGSDDSAVAHDGHTKTKFTPILTDDSIQVTAPTFTRDDSTPINMPSIKRDDIPTVTPFVFLVANGFSCEGGTNLAVREVSAATNYPEFRCDTYIVDCFGGSDRHNTYDYEASDQVRNIYHTKHTGLVRPVRDSAEFLKYYQEPNDVLETLATYRGISLSDLAAKIASFLEICISEGSSNDNKRLPVGVYGSKERRFFAKLLLNHRHYHVFDAIQFYVYTLPNLPLYPSFAMVPPSLQENMEHHWRYLKGHTDCSAFRAWYYLTFRDDPVATRWHEHRASTGLNTGEQTPIESPNIKAILKYHRIFKEFRYSGWCTPATDESTPVTQYNALCGYNILSADDYGGPPETRIEQRWYR